MKFWKKLDGLKTWQWSLLGASIGFVITLFLAVISILSGILLNYSNTSWISIPLETIVNISFVILGLPTYLLLILILGIFELLPQDPWGQKVLGH